MKPVFVSADVIIRKETYLNILDTSTIFELGHYEFKPAHPVNYFLQFLGRAVASLTVPGGQKFHFLIFSSNFDQFFLRLYLFSSSFWPSEWASHPPEKALATPLFLGKNIKNCPPSKSFLFQYLPIQTWDLW